MDRVESRKHLSTETRLALLEQADRTHENSLSEVKDEIRGLKKALYATAASLLLFALSLAMTLNVTGALG